MFNFRFRIHQAESDYHIYNNIFTKPRGIKSKTTQQTNFPESEQKQIYSSHINAKRFLFFILANPNYIYRCVPIFSVIYSQCTRGKKIQQTNKEQSKYSNSRVDKSKCDREKS